jgi:hypothetical protein
VKNILLACYQDRWNLEKRINLLQKRGNGYKIGGIARE